MGAIEFVIRDGETSDRGFIASTFVSTCRMAMHRGQLNRMPDGAFNAYHYAHVGRLFDKCSVSVACSPEDRERLYGYSLTEGNQVHMVYVSKSHWRAGIAKALTKKLSVSDVVFRLWPNMQNGSSTEWLWPRLEGLKYVPYWIDLEKK